MLRLFERTVLRHNQTADNDTFGAKRKERLDSVSAAVILESFLNWRAHHPDEEPPEMLRPQPAEV